MTEDGRGGREGGGGICGLKPSNICLIHKVNHHHCSHQRDWGEGRGGVCVKGGGETVKHFYLKAVYTNQIRQRIS